MFLLIVFTSQASAPILTDDIIGSASTDTDCVVTPACLHHAFHVTGAALIQLTIRNALGELLIGMRLVRTRAHAALAEGSLAYAVVGQPTEVADS